MVPIILLLAALIQVARCGNECFVRGSHGGASLGGKVQSADDCHQLIDAVSQMNASNTLWIDVNDTAGLEKGSCGAVIYNKLNKKAGFPLTTLAFQMTANILNPCITNGSYGQWWDDSVLIWMYHVRSGY